MIWRYIQKDEKTKLKGKQSGLDSIMSRLQGSKGANTGEKAKRDWETDVEKNKLEKVLEQNRKDGYMAKQKFLDDTEKAEKEKAKGNIRHLPKFKK